jgi:hypothetical protein
MAKAVEEWTDARLNDLAAARSWGLVAALVGAGAAIAGALL